MLFSIFFSSNCISYDYCTYGMYFMLNVVAKSKRQDAGAVLIRGIFPQEGIKTMITNRGIKDLSKITNGPAKITMAMNISMKENNVDMTKNSTIYISDGIPIKKIKKSPRVGISKAVEKEWNFSINPKNYFEELKLIKGDLGARNILHRNEKDLNRFETDDDSYFIDLDTVEDFNNWRNRLSN